MSAKKPKRGAPTVDMTAMVDVAFLLLTFFILTTTSFREEEKVEVDMPSSVSNLEVPEKGLCIISLSDEGDVYIGFTDIGTREEVLRRYMQDQEVQLSEEGLSYFSNLKDFGVPLDSVGTWLNSDPATLEAFPHNGIPTPTEEEADSTGEAIELRSWVRWGRLADQKMRFAVKGDEDTPYPRLKAVTDALQFWKVNQFSLITDLEDGGGESAGSEGGE
jgi:biopolymer transport protein ExbD